MSNGASNSGASLVSASCSASRGAERLRAVSLRQLPALWIAVLSSRNTARRLMVAATVDYTGVQGHVYTLLSGQASFSQLTREDGDLLRMHGATLLYVASAVS
jgi:hypothetical protein